MKLLTDIDILLMFGKGTMVRNMSFNIQTCKSK